MGVDTAELVAPIEVENARRRLRDEGSRAPSEWRPAFEDLAARVFDPNFSLEQLRRARGLRDAAHSASFRRCFGCTPGEYLRRWRVETAVCLLGRRQLEIWQVAQMVGFASRRSFEKAVQRLCGASPAALRARMSGAPAPAQEPPPRGQVRRLVALALDPPAAAAEIRRLRRERGDHRAARGTGIEAFERGVAERWWCFLRELPDGERRQALRGALFETPALFEHLCRASRDEGRDNRQRGIEIAELALESLRLLRRHLDPAALARLESRGWAYLGNAFALALDYAGAERAFDAARRTLTSHPEAADVEAEVLYLLSCLRAYQRRLIEARELGDRAIALCPPGPSRLRGEVLLGRGSTCTLLGEQRAALADYEAALAALDPERDPYLVCVATHNIANSLCFLGEHEAASRWLARAEPIARRLGQRGPLCHVLWLAGLLAFRLGRTEQSARSLREAYANLRALGQHGHAAIAALDLAHLEVSTGRSEAALELVAQTLPTLEALGLEAEALSALGLLRGVLETRQLNATSLERLRAALGRSLGAPAL